jgi:hypothetical protein
MPKQFDRYIAAIQHDDGTESRIRIMGSRGISLVHVESWYRSRCTDDHSVWKIDQGAGLCFIVLAPRGGNLGL